MLKNKFPYQIIKRHNLKALNQKIAHAQEEISFATDFIKNIEKGNLETLFEDSVAEQQKNTALASSLLSMRAQMKKVSQEEKERNWSTEGFARFVDILRSKNDDLTEMADNIFSNLINYLEVNQGALYLINDEDPDNTFIEMLSCYAFDRKKYLNKQIALGEGLVGQVVLEKETIYMTDIPDHYVRITSGLGGALPRNLLIVPLKLNEKVLGVIEIASFTKIENYKIQFVERLGESIASTISSVKVSQVTKQLLEESQQQAEEMKAQEEEMRQNMEELSATQEDMERAMKETQEKEAYLSNLINASKDSIFAIDTDYKIIVSNKVFNESLAAVGMKVEKGFSMKDISQDKSEVELYDKAFAGEIVEVTNEYSGKHYIITYNPIRGADNEVLGLVAFTKDVTEQQTLIQQTQLQADELRAQEEVMRQNMEELSASQEELDRTLSEIQKREKYLHELINVSKDVIFTLSRDYKIRSFNKAYQDTIGASGTEVNAGMDALQFFSEEEKQHYKSIYDDVFKGESFELNHNFSAEGHESYMSVYYAPLRGQDGKVIEAAVFAKDITETTVLQRDIQLRENALNLTTILSESDLYGTITFVNKKLCAVSGYSENELLGKPHNMLRHEDMPKALFKLLWDTIKTGEPFHAIVKNKTKNGGQYWVDATIMPVKDGEGKVTKYIGARYHITNSDLAIVLYNEQARALNLPELK